MDAITPLLLNLALGLAGLLPAPDVGPVGPSARGAFDFERPASVELAKGDGFVEVECKELILANWTECWLYVILLLDCDGDGEWDTFDETFIPPAHEDGPGYVVIEPNEGCVIVGFEFIETAGGVGDCEPEPYYDAWFDCVFHYL